MQRLDQPPKSLEQILDEQNMVSLNFPTKLLQLLIAPLFAIPFYKNALWIKSQTHFLKATFEYVS